MKTYQTNSETKSGNLNGDPTIAINGIYLAKKFYGSGFHSYLNNLLLEIIKTDHHNHLKNNYLVYSTNFYETCLDDPLFKAPFLKKKTLVQSSKHYLDDLVKDLKKNYPTVKKIFLPHLEFIPAHIKKNGFSIFMTIHDIIPILNLNPYYLKKFKLPLKNTSLKGVLDYFLIKKNTKLVDRFITISETSKKDLNFIFKNLDKKVSVISPLISPVFKKYKKDQVDQIIKPYQLTYKKYVIYFGGHTLRKNVKKLLAYWNGKASINYPLVVIGGGDNKKKYSSINGSWDNDEKNKIKHKIQYKNSGQKKIIFLNKLEISSLAKLISGGLFSIYPTLYEGYGMPVLESLRCHTFPLASSIPSTIEITKNLLPTFDPNDFSGLDEIIKQYADPVTAEKLITTILKKIEISRETSMLKFDRLFQE